MIKNHFIQFYNFGTFQKRNVYASIKFKISSPDTGFVGGFSWLLFFIKENEEKMP